MANNIDVAEANRLLNASLGTTAYTNPTGPMKLALLTAQGNATTPGTEVSGGGYARQTITFGTASAGSASSNTTVNFTNMPAATVTGVEIYDSAGTPRRAWQGPLDSPRAVGAGDTLSFASSSSVASLG